MLIINSSKDSLEKVIINDIASFNKWEESLQQFHINNFNKLYSFNLQEFSFSENIAINADIDYYGNAHGSNTSCVAMCIAFVVTICSYFLSGNHFFAINLLDIVSLFVITTGGAFIGKLIGKVNAYLSLIKICRNVRKRIYKSMPEQNETLYHTNLTISSPTQVI